MRCWEHVADPQDRRRAADGRAHADAAAGAGGGRVHGPGQRVAAVPRLADHGALVRGREFLVALAGAAAGAGECVRAVARGRCARAATRAPFMLTLCFFGLGFAGLVLGIWPNIVPPAMSIWQAAVAAVVAVFVLGGASCSCCRRSSATRAGRTGCSAARSRRTRATTESRSDLDRPADAAAAEQPFANGKRSGMGSAHGEPK